MGTIFKFRFQRVLEMREREVESWEKRLAQHLLAVYAAEAALQRLGVERKLLNAAWQSAVTTGLRADAGQTFQLCFQDLTRRDSAAATALKTVRKEEADCRTALAKALARCKAMEKVRERFQARHRLETNRREQAELDDFVVLRAGWEVA